MAQPGRKPTPSAIKRRRGNPGRRPMNEREPKPPSGAPAMPRGLFDAEAAREWKRLSKRLDALGLLNECDGNLMARYCVAWSLWVKTVRRLWKDGQVLISKKGGEYASAYFNNLLALDKRLAAGEAEMGLTSSSRTRIQATPKVGKPEGKARFFKVVG
jgi:P27 family predicted phage terminase small subunit